MASYSDESLLEKMGYSAGDSVYCVHAPKWFYNELKTASITTVHELPTTWLHGFFTDRAELIEFLTQTDANKIEKGFWMSWPKESSGVVTDVTEQTFRDLILPMGWVDIKVAAIDDTWCGLKFLRRKA
jgi:hypothetical protein